MKPSSLANRANSYDAYCGPLSEATVSVKRWISGAESHSGDVVSGQLVYLYVAAGVIFNKIAIQGAPQMAVDKEAISLSRVYSYYSKCNLPLFYV